MIPLSGPLSAGVIWKLYLFMCKGLFHQMAVDLDVIAHSGKNPITG